MTEIGCFHSLVTFALSESPARMFMLHRFDRRSKMDEFCCFSVELAGSLRPDAMSASFANPDLPNLQGFPHDNGSH